MVRNIYYNIWLKFPKWFKWFFLDISEFIPNEEIRFYLRPYILMGFGWNVWRKCEEV